MGTSSNLTDPMNTAKSRLVEVNYDTGGGVFQSTLVVAMTVPIAPHLDEGDRAARQRLLRRISSTAASP